MLPEGPPEISHPEMLRPGFSAWNSTFYLRSEYNKTIAQKTHSIQCENIAGDSSANCGPG